MLLCRRNHALPRVRPTRHAVCDGARHAVHGQADCAGRGADKYLARYIYTHPQVVCIFEQQDWVDEITIITDADWATDADTGRSVDCVHIFLGGHLLETSTQHFIALSTVESEFYGIIRGAACGLQLRELLMERGMKMKVRVRTDSSAAKGVVKRSGSGKMKHMAAKHLWIQEVARQGTVDVTTIDTLHNTADLGTKCHPERRLQELLQMMPVAIGFDLVPGTVRKGLFLASLLKGASAAKGQREEGMTEDKMSEDVMVVATGALMSAIIVMYITLRRSLYPDDLPVICQACGVRRAVRTCEACWRLACTPCGFDGMSCWACDWINGEADVEIGEMERPAPQ